MPGAIRQNCVVFGGAWGGVPFDAASREAVESVERLTQDLGIPRRLRDLDISEGSLDLTAEQFIEMGQRLLANNPRTLSIEEAREILRMAH